MISVCTLKQAVYTAELFIQVKLFLLGRYANKSTGGSGLIHFLIS